MFWELVSVLLCPCTLSRAHDLNRIVIHLGVVGLTTALKIQLQGNYRVTVVSEIIPSDPKSIKYTSRWAVRCKLTTNYHVALILFLQGAHHVYNTFDEPEIHGQTLYR